jgi:hypothetical protein
MSVRVAVRSTRGDTVEALASAIERADAFVVGTGTPGGARRCAA